MSVEPDPGWPGGGLQNRWQAVRFCRPTLREVILATGCNPVGFNLQGGRRGVRFPHLPFVGNQPVMLGDKAVTNKMLGLI
jgi:hypothetical protein